MTKTYTTKEAQEISGLSRKDLFTFKDVVNATYMHNIARKKVDGNDYDGYKTYLDDDIDRLIVIGFLKKLGKENAEIKKLLRSDNFDEIQTLQDIIDEANNRIKSLQNIIAIAEDAKYSGFTTLKLNILSLKSIDNLSEYTRKIRENEKTKKVYNFIDNLSEEKVDEMCERIKKFEKLISNDINSKKEENATNNLIDFFKTNLNAEDGYIVLLALNYQGTGLTSRSIDQMTRPGVSHFIGDAIVSHYDKLIEKEIDDLIGNVDVNEFESKGITDEEEIAICATQKIITVIKKYYAEFITNDVLKEICSKYLIREESEDKEFNRIFKKAIDNYEEENN